VDLPNNDFGILDWEISKFPNSKFQNAFKKIDPALKEAGSIFLKDGTISVFHDQVANFEGFSVGFDLG